MVRKPLLPPGDVEIEVEAEDGARSLGRASVRAREETRFEIRLE